MPTQNSSVPLYLCPFVSTRIPAETGFGCMGPERLLPELALSSQERHLRQRNRSLPVIAGVGFA